MATSSPGRAGRRGRARPMAMPMSRAPPMPTSGRPDEDAARLVGLVEQPCHDDRVARRDRAPRPGGVMAGTTRSPPGGRGARGTRAAPGNERPSDRRLCRPGRRRERSGERGATGEPEAPGAIGPAGPGVADPDPRAGHDPGRPDVLMTCHDRIRGDPERSTLGEVMAIEGPVDGQPVAQAARVLPAAWPRARPVRGGRRAWPPSPRPAPGPG